MKRIALLEDDEAIRDVFLLAFSNLYEFIALETGEKILSNEIEPPDLFILDKSVSGTDGLAICRHIKNTGKYKAIPVIMLSANPEIATLANEVGADGAIAKPFSLKTLREALNKILEA